MGEQSCGECGRSVGDADWCPYDGTSVRESNDPGFRGSAAAAYRSLASAPLMWLLLWVLAGIGLMVGALLDPGLSVVSLVSERLWNVSGFALGVWVGGAVSLLCFILAWTGAAWVAGRKFRARPPRRD